MENDNINKSTNTQKEINIIAWANVLSILYGIKNFLNELNTNINCITIFVDNKATIYNGENQSINPKSKYIDIRYHHIRDLVSKKNSLN